MDTQRLHHLLDLQLEQQLSSQQEEELNTLLKNEEAEQTLAEHIRNNAIDPQSLDEATTAAVFKKLMDADKPEQTRTIPLRYTIPAAAAAILIIILTTYFYTTHTGKTTTTIAQQEDIAPGHNGAILTLSNGSRLTLDSMHNGIIATQGGSQIKLQNGQLAYTNSRQAEQITYNTLTTPKGRQFRIELPDGSTVWLNAASSIRYPTTFTGAERTVEITGEAYFDIAKQANTPFRIITRHTKIEVLGTQFNVNAYDDEPATSTTLLQGSIRVNKDILKPGQQAQTTQTAQHIITTADTGKITAWKNGLFNFEDATLEEIMRQLERWYDIKVVYESNIPHLEFVGKMNRDMPLSGVLLALRKSEVHFRVEGRKLIVLP